jgi:hypothetical protein
MILLVEVNGIGGRLARIAQTAIHFLGWPSRKSASCTLSDRDPRQRFGQFIERFTEFTLDQVMNGRGIWKFQDLACDSIRNIQDRVAMIPKQALDSYFYFVPGQ